jgi:acyl-CoA dehydrogenase
MRFELDEDRALLKSSTRELLERESALADARAVMEGPEGFSEKLYAQLGELGYLGLALPESEGGAGVGVIGLAAVLHEAGRVAFPGPYLDLVLAGEALRRAGGDAGGRWLGELVAGRKRVVLARSEGVAGLEAAIPSTRFAAGRVVGTKTFVPFGAAADALLVTTAEGLALVERPATGFCATALPTFDHAQRFVEVALDLPGTLIASPDATTALLEAVDRLGALGAAALLLGLAERSLELSVAYLKDRKAFGVPIGSFQGLQHRAAEMLLRVESTRSAVYRAAWAFDHAPDQAALLAAAAKAYAGDAARFVCGETIQIFGGVGYTWEYDPHIYWKRVKTLEQFYGSTRSQLDRVLEAAGI